MTTETDGAKNLKDQAAKGRRGRGVTKPFPPLSLDDSTVLAQVIHDHGINGRMRRTSVFDRLGKSPDSGPSRTLVINSGRYGLTTGGYTAEYLTLTDVGRAIVDASTPEGSLRRLKFERAVTAFEPFAKLHDRLKDKRLTGQDVVQDELVRLGVSREDAPLAYRVFMDNAASIGLIKDTGGAQRLMSIDEATEDLPERDEQEVPPKTELHRNGATGRVGPPVAPPTSSPVASGGALMQGGPTSRVPSVHVDIQIHIDANASAEQIDQMFASMAKHLSLGNSDS